MSKCENCIHNEVCDHNRFGYENCNSFKDKSLCVELPCKVGQKLYDAREFFYKQPCPDIYELCDNVMYIYEDNLLTYDGMFITKDEIGKTVFLTKEEAERKLKEMGE